MAEIAEARLALISGKQPPDPDGEQVVLGRLKKKFPELCINPNRERKILVHARLFLNSRNN